MGTDFDPGDFTLAAARGPLLFLLSRGLFSWLCICRWRLLDQWNCSCASSSTFNIRVTGEEDHVEDEDESTGAEDRDDDGQDDVQLPVLLLLQAEPCVAVERLSGGVEKLGRGGCQRLLHPFAFFSSRVSSDSFFLNLDLLCAFSLHLSALDHPFLFRRGTFKIILLLVQNFT